VEEMVSSEPICAYKESSALLVGDQSNTLQGTPVHVQGFRIASTTLHVQSMHTVSQGRVGLLQIGYLADWLVNRCEPNSGLVSTCIGASGFVLLRLVSICSVAQT